MIIKTVAILLFLFIFGITTQGYADSVKSKKNTVNQETMMKIDENKVALQKKAGIVKDPIKTSKNHTSEFQTNISYKDRWWVTDNAKLNFLKTLEEKKKTSSADYLDKVIYSYGFSQNTWGEKFLNFRRVAEAKSLNSDVNQSHLGSYPPGNKIFEERRILEVFKLLQLKREEISKEIVLGFRLSFNPVSGHMFLEMNVTPSFEKGSGFIIPF
jgi:hypothetical protein